MWEKVWFVRGDDEEGSGNAQVSKEFTREVGLQVALLAEGNDAEEEDNANCYLPGFDSREVQKRIILKLQVVLL